MRSTYARVTALVGYHLVPHTVCHYIYSDINGQRVNKESCPCQRKREPPRQTGSTHPIDTVFDIQWSGPLTPCEKSVTSNALLPSYSFIQTSFKLHVTMCSFVIGTEHTLLIARATHLANSATGSQRVQIL